jgi:hypothetical protein
MNVKVDKLLLGYRTSPVSGNHLSTFCDRFKPDQGSAEHRVTVSYLFQADSCQIGEESVLTSMKKWSPSLQYKLLPQEVQELQNPSKSSSSNWRSLMKPETTSCADFSGPKLPKRQLLLSSSLMRLLPPRLPSAEQPINSFSNGSSGCEISSQI